MSTVAATTDDAVASVQVQPFAVPTAGLNADFGISSGWDASKKTDLEMTPGWSKAKITESTLGIAYDTMPRKDTTLALPGDPMAHKDKTGSLPWSKHEAADGRNEVAYRNRMTTRDAHDSIPWDQSKVSDNDMEMGHIVPPFKDLAFRHPWDSFHVADAEQAQPYNVPPPVERDWRINWGYGSYDRPDWIGNLVFDIQPDEIPELPPIPADLQVYILMPTATIVTVPGGDPIQASSVQVSTDLDSWCWQFSAEVIDPASVALIKPDSNGPKEIDISINGVTWRMLVEGYQRSRSFGKASHKISGRSLSAYLSEPYATRKSQEILTSYSANQLVNLELPVGWTSSWQIPDWTVTGGAWSYANLDPISAIKAIAASAGAVVQTEPLTQRINIVSRYPVSPNLWGSAALDAILPIAMTITDSSQWAQRPAYNRSYVAGQSQGVLVNASKSGTAGDILTPMIVDPLITNVIAGQERARVEISRGGNWELLSLSTIVTDSPDPPGVIIPGSLVEFQEPGGNWRALASGVSVRAVRTDKSLSVGQSLELERYHA